MLCVYVIILAFYGCFRANCGFEIQVESSQQDYSCHNCFLNRMQRMRETQICQKFEWNDHSQICVMPNEIL